MDSISNITKNGCVFVDSQNVYYTLKKWLNKSLPERYIDWDSFFSEVFERISVLENNATEYRNSYWFRPTKFIDFYPENRMTKYHLTRHFDESIANDYLNLDNSSPESNDNKLLEILFQYEKNLDIEKAKKSKMMYEKISNRYKAYFEKRDKMHFIETGFIKYDFIKKERSEKAVDVSLASHLLFCAMASNEHLRISNGEHIKIPPSDVVVLLSNDDDYIETISLLEAIDFPIYVICFRNSKNQRSDLMDRTKSNRFVFGKKDMDKYISKRNSK